jgi:flagellar basal body-associated protein FliL
MDEKPSDKPTKGYGKHSKMYWVIIYLVVAIIVYGIIYLLFIHKGSSSGGFKY